MTCMLSFLDSTKYSFTHSAIFLTTFLYYLFTNRFLFTYTFRFTNRFLFTYTFRFTNWFRFAFGRFTFRY